MIVPETRRCYLEESDGNGSITGEVDLTMDQYIFIKNLLDNNQWKNRMNHDNYTGHCRIYSPEFEKILKGELDGNESISN